jgi:hypothetical protein
MEPQPLSKTQGSQTYKNHLVVRTPLYRHSTVIAHEFSPNKSQRRNCTADLHHLEVWEHPVKVCAYLRNRPSRLARKRELASDIKDKYTVWTLNGTSVLHSSSTIGTSDNLPIMTRGGRTYPVKAVWVGCRRYVEPRQSVQKAGTYHAIYTATCEIVTAFRKLPAGGQMP